MTRFMPVALEYACRLLNFNYGYGHTILITRPDPLNDRRADTFSALRSLHHSDLTTGDKVIARPLMQLS